jgi:FG-GAP repeat
LDIKGDAKGDHFGNAVSISADGTTFVVGAPYHDGNGTDSGLVRVYQYNSTIGSYAHVGLDMTGANSFGWSLSISADGTTVVAGAPFLMTVTGLILVMFVCTSIIPPCTVIAKLEWISMVKQLVICLVFR